MGPRDWRSTAKPKIIGKIGATCFEGQPGGQHHADGAFGDTPAPAWDPRSHFRLRRGKKSQWNLERLTGMEPEYVTRSTGVKLQEIVRRLSEDRQLWRMDRTRAIEIEHQGVRYVAAAGEWRAQRDLDRRQSSVAQSFSPGGAHRP
ncbi:MAG: hypothetical protein PHO89_10725 [Methylacidiphilaceae bacterium]|nr:hypothetical protein [Candidatus Methylacidiphilaceae bacterium]